MGDALTGNEVADIALRRMEWVLRHIEKRCHCKSDKSCRKNSRSELRLTMRVMGQCIAKESPTPGDGSAEGR